ncbi:MAG: 30S ribosomal protein S12 methylthiotransferase RimO [Eubacterium sp.]|nr:30S ribosomal protein S12 methylthiotransferase RimO [Eubacterium sp.]
MRNVCFISLGCDKNLVDSEKMLGLLQEGGYQICQEESMADAIVINTCCFIHDAKEESIETILEVSRWKEEGHLKFLVVTGCLAQRYADEMEEALPEVDAVIGISGYDRIVPVLDQLFEGAAGKERLLSYLPDLDRQTSSYPDKRVITTGPYTAYLKIAEGCDKFCSYCIIPYIRGRYRSVPMEDLLSEAENLAAKGVRELLLVAQETTLYGTDLYGRKALPELLRKLCAIEGLQWIRILYCYPEEITEELIQTMKEEPKICHYLDMPIQHCEDRILKSMGRKTSREELVGLVGHLREEIPDIILRTTLITGYPGETEEESDRMYDFVDEMEFDRLGVFTFSPEEGTKAALMPDQVEDSVKEARRDKIMMLQQEISADHLASLIGTEMEVMIEGYLYEEDIYIGRTYMDAPKVDGNVFVRSGEEMISGDIVPVRITGANEYDMMGDVIYADEFAE